MSEFVGTLESALRYGKPKRCNPRLLALPAPYVFADFELKHYEQELL